MDANDKKQAARETTKKQHAIFIKSFQIAIEFGFIIALPLIVFGKLGQYLDSRNQTKYFVLIGVLMALAASCLWIYRRIRDILEDLKKQ